MDRPRAVDELRGLLFGCHAPDQVVDPPVQRLLRIEIGGRRRLRGRDSGELEDGGHEDHGDQDSGGATRSVDHENLPRARRRGAPWTVASIREGPAVRGVSTSGRELGKRREVEPAAVGWGQSRDRTPTGGPDEEDACLLPWHSQCSSSPRRPRRDLDRAEERRHLRGEAGRHDAARRRAAREEDHVHVQGLCGRLLRDDAALAGPLAAYKGKAESPEFYKALQTGDFKKQVVLKFLRTLSQGKIQEAMRESLAGGDPNTLAQFISYFPEVKEGEECVLRHVGGGKLESVMAGVGRSRRSRARTSSGRLFGLYVGPTPIQPDIKVDVVARAAQVLK